MTAGPLVHAVSGVADFEHYLRGSHNITGFNRQSPAAGHRLARVHRKVHQYLMHLAPIRFDGSQIRGETRADVDIVAENAIQYPLGVANELIEIEGTRPHDLL